jgi:hypothetical protein
MNDALRDELRRGGWRSSARYKGFLETRRVGIEFHVGRPRSGDERLELRYRYQTERTDSEGTVDLPADAGPERVGDAMTTIYLRVHEKPDPSRTFGPRRAARAARATAPPGVHAPTAEAPEARQSSLDLFDSD